MGAPMADVNEPGIRASEFERWADDDRAWKKDLLDRVVNHGERLTRLETVRDAALQSKTNAENAASDAALTRKWAVVGGIVAAIINGFLLAFGGHK